MAQERPHVGLQLDQSDQLEIQRKAEERAWVTYRSNRPSCVRLHKRKGSGKRSCNIGHNDCIRHVDKVSIGKESCPVKVLLRPNAAWRRLSVWCKRSRLFCGSLRRLS